MLKLDGHLSAQDHHFFLDYMNIFIKLVSKYGSTNGTKNNTRIIYEND
jgi:hypothetical protein